MLILSKWYEAILKRLKTKEISLMGKLLLNATLYINVPKKVPMEAQSLEFVGYSITC